MKFTRRQLRKTIRRVLKESVMGHLDGNISNIVFHAAQMVGEEWGEITVDDVLEKISSMNDQHIASYADPSGVRPEGAQEYIDFFVSSARELDYEMVLEKMFELVDMGELADGYEDIFTLPGGIL
tara:strand:- start:787 stop:1161 length:375 start_codon:yes stop_codon:yes gene_type:complete